MEVLSRRGWIRDDHVAFGAQLEEPLQPRARVLRPLSLVAVRQQQHETGVLSPLRAIRGDELVDDRLGDVGEVAELRLPQHQLARRRRAEPVLESHHRRLGQRAVVDLEGRFGLRQLRQRRVGLAGRDVVQHRLPMREGPALDVLAGEPNPDAFDEQRRERQRFRVAPVDPAVLERVATARQGALDRGMQLE